MKHFITTFLLASILIAAFAQNNVIVQASNSQVNQGEEINYPISINPNGNNLVAFSFKLEYNPNIVQVLDLQKADGWTFATNASNIGLLIVGGYTTNAESASFNPLSILFKAIGSSGSSSPIKLNEIKVFNSEGEIGFQQVNGQISIEGENECVLLNTACDDNNECTINDKYNLNCECVGIAIPDCGSCRYTDSLALVAVYEALNGNDWYSSYQWDFTKPMNTWRGVTLNANGCVDRLNLDEDGISGLIATEIGNLSELTYLNLSENQISGSIPNTIGNLTNLEYLYLGDNQLTLGIPTAITDLTNLKRMDLGNNQLMGSIPSAIGDLYKLTHLYLGNCHLNGGIPSSIGNLTQLTNLSLSKNNLNGSIPAVIGNLIKLTSLSLDNNQLSGAVPAAIGNLTNLTSLSFHNNQLTNLSASIGNLNNLRTLNVNDNRISGNLPSWLLSMNNLSNFRIQNNQMSGCYESNLAPLCDKLPYNRNNTISNGNNFNAPWEDFCNTRAGDCNPQPTCRETDSLALMAVFSAFNRADFYSSQPMDAWRGVMLNANGCVDELEFDEMGFTGMLAPEIGDLSEIRSIDMEENAIKGTIPSTIGNLTNLETLNLSDNQLEGNIPTSFVNLTNLNSLYLGRNNLSGSIPSNFNSLVELTSLDLADNQLTGNMPVWLSSLNNLVYLRLSNNLLNGCYDNNLEILCNQLSYSSNYYISDGNNFDARWEDFCNTRAGDCQPPSNCTQDKEALLALYNEADGANWENPWNLSTSINQWHGVSLNDEGCVTRLDLGFNKLTGTIPAQLGNLSKLTHLLLGNNKLNGTIPKELGNLSNLYALRLNSNNLSGGIPNELENLSNLNILSLNFNQLTGNIPPELGKLNSLTHLWLSFNQLNGTIPSQLLDLTNLKQLSLSYNQLNGVISSGFGNLTQINDLSLTSNQFSGTIPSELGNLNLLQYLRLGDNQFSGTIPPEISSLNNLLYLEVRNNQLSGCYDENLSTLCTSLSNYSKNYNISYGNNFNLPWEDFCSGVSCIDTKTKSPNQSTIEIDNFPNPFSGETTIGYNLPNQKRITLFVTDMMGKKVATLLNNEQQTKGSHAINFDGSKYPTGVYYYTLQAGDYIKTQKMILMR